jgi:hypothetical protein
MRGRRCEGERGRKGEVGLAGADLQSVLSHRWRGFAIRAMKKGITIARITNLG